jgi:monovalent cation:H+ antiporter-2, CPA2 family
VILAAGAAPEFLVPVAAIVITAAAVAWVCQRLGLVPIVGFLLAGMAIGPHALGLVDREETVQAAADIGVILLLFVIGIEFNLGRLARERRMLLGGGLATILGATAVTAALVLPFGVDATSATYSGLLVSVSSTAVVLSLLASRRQTTSEAGRASVAILIFEDLAVIAMVLFIPTLGSDASSPLDVLRPLVVAAAVIVAVIVGARRVMPKVLEAAARVCSAEVFLLTVLAICFATGYLTQLAGAGVSLGAFLAGLLVSESRLSAHALGEILPLEIIFTATFFISIGMLIDPGFLVDEAGVVASAVVVVLVVKTLTGTAAAMLFGLALPVALSSALLRAQIGEFSFVLEGAGREAGLTPLGLDERGVQLFLATSVLLMVITPVLSPLVDRGLSRRIVAARSAGAAGGDPGPPGSMTPPGDRPGSSEPDDHGTSLSGHVVVAGYGNNARALVPALQLRGIPLVVTTLSPDGADHAAAAGAAVLRGDATKSHLLERAGVRRAAVVVVADDDLALTERIATLAHELNPGARIVALVDTDEHLAELAGAGVSDLVAADRARHSALVAAVTDIAADIDDGRGSVRPAGEVVVVHPVPDSPCGHLDQIRPVAARSAGCEECVALGLRWVHLRICLTCGHVGCCDNSEGRHARAHHREHAHSVIASFEPEEQWAWCFTDELEVELDTTVTLGHPATDARTERLGPTGG